MFSSNTSAVSGDANYIEDVFSTYLFTGTGTATAINNGIDLSTKGGLVWIKDRNSGAMGHALFDTARGGAYKLQSQSTNGQSSYNNIVFGTTGFTNDTQSDNNNSGTLYTSWTFRKQPKFFDVVTYTGTGSAQNIAHSLGSTPGCVIVKRTDDASNWAVYHRGLTSASYWILLNNTLQQVLDTTAWNATAPTSTQFTVGSASYTNTAGGTYVAYIFAHNAGGFGLTGTDNVITCGSYTGTGAAGNAINLGFEPQWVLIKNSTAGSYPNWFTFDNMRGMTVGNGDPYLYANSASAEAGGSAQYIDPTATGFNMMNANVINESGQTYIYIAIRRGPMKVPTDGTKVFKPVAYTGTSATRTITGVGFPLDMNITMDRATHTYNVLSDRLRGLTCDGSATQPQLRTNATDAEFAVANGLNGTLSSAMDGYTLYGAYSQMNASPDTYISYNFRRAPSFFDEVCYTGTGTSGQTYSHNLGVTPELIIFKRRESTSSWWVWSSTSALTTSYYLNLNSVSAKDAFSLLTGVTSTTFSCQADTSTNANAGTYAAYLFASCPGVSKVGSYTGTGTTKQVDCGFAAGARFVLIKRTDSSGDWYVWDTARGIVSGNDPYLLLNTTDAEVTSTDYIDTYSAGFELSSTAPAALNASGGTYIFLAIA